MGVIPEWYEAAEGRAAPPSHLATAVARQAGEPAAPHCLAKKTQSLYFTFSLVP